MVKILNSKTEDGGWVSGGSVWGMESSNKIEIISRTVSFTKIPLEISLLKFRTEL